MGIYLFCRSLKSKFDFGDSIITENSKVTYIKPYEHKPGARITNTKKLLAEKLAVIGWCFSIS